MSNHHPNIHSVPPVGRHAIAACALAVVARLGAPARGTSRIADQIVDAF